MWYLVYYCSRDDIGSDACSVKYLLHYNFYIKIRPLKTIKFNASALNIIQVLSLHDAISVVPRLDFLL